MQNPKAKKLPDNFNVQEAIYRIRGFDRKGIQESLRRNKLPIDRRQSTDKMKMAYLQYLAVMLANKTAEIKPAEIKYAEKQTEKENKVDTQRKPILFTIEKFDKKLPKEYPYRVSATASVSTYSYLLTFPVRNIKNKDGRNKYLYELYEWLFPYEPHQSKEEVRSKYIYYVDFKLVDAVDKQKMIRVADYSAENCVINILRNRGLDVDKLYTKYPNLNPTNGKVYITHENIEELARCMQVKIVTYTKLGLITNRPWHTYGYQKGKKIPIKLESEHATIAAQKLSIDEIIYHDALDIPDTTDIVDKEWYRPERNANPNDPLQPMFYTSYDRVIHKTFRPSSVTKNPLDDFDLANAYVFSADQMMFKLFKKQFDIQPIKNDKVRSIIKSAEHFIKKCVFEELKGDIYEIDHNKSYTSAEFSPYYQGFPTNNLTPVTLEFSTNPAFYVLDTIDNPPLEFQILYNYLEGPIVITTPMYKYLESRGADMVVDYVIDSRFRDISILGFADQFDIPQERKKLFCNSLIGRSITGGLACTKIVHCPYSNIAECNQIIHECQTLDYQYIQHDSIVEVHLPTRQDGLFHFHSYILAYSGIAMLSKFHELHTDCSEIVGYNVDAIIFKNVRNYDDSCHPGGWKTKKLDSKSYFHQLKVSQYEAKHYHDSDLALKPLNRKIYNNSTIIIAAAGIGKSHTFINQPSYNQVILTPTKTLRNQFRANGAIAHTSHKYFQFTISDKKFYKMRQFGQLPQATDIIIDEAFMYTKEQWKIIERRKGTSTIIALGDPEQIRCAVNGTPVDMSFFEHYDCEYRTRLPDSPARHSYQDGLLLDALRESDDKTAFVLSNFETAEHVVDPTRLVVVGTHDVAKRYNTLAKAHCNSTGELFPFKNKDREIVYLPVGTPRAWWGRKGMLDVPPKGTKYEPAYAVTVDSVQGKTIERLAVDLKSLNRHGSVYTAMTRTRQLANTIVLQ